MISFVQDNAVYLAGARGAINHNPGSRIWPGWFLLLCLLISAPLRGEISGNGAPPAAAVPIAVHVSRGGTIVIPLATYGPKLSVKYLARTRPKFGTLSPLQVLENGDGRVTYRHSGEKTSESDQFTYAAQTFRGVSAAATVQIVIDDAPAQLDGPTTLTFGDVPLGESVSKSITLTNHGGSDATGFLRTTEPWRTDGGTLYKIAEGGQQAVALVFTPSYLGPVEGALNYTSSSTLVTTLHGRGVPPFAVSVAAITIAATPPRLVTISVNNPLDHEVVLQVKAPAPFIAPETLAVPARSSAELPLSVSESLVEPADGVVDIFSDAFAAHVKVSADAILPHLELADTAADFAKTVVGETATATLTVKNTGRRTAQVVASTTAPFVLAAAERNFSLEPQASRAIHLQFKPDAIGAAQATLVIEADAQRLTADLRGESLPVPTQYHPSAPVPESTLAAAANVPEEPAAPVELSKVPAIKSLTAAKIHRTAILLTWPLPPNPGLSYEVQRRILYRDSARRLHGGWEPILGAQIHVSGNTGSTWITGLPARSFLIARVVSRDARNLPSQPSPELRVMTTGFTWPSLLQFLLLALAILIGLIVYHKWQERRAVAAMD